METVQTLVIPKAVGKSVLIPVEKGGRQLLLLSLQGKILPQLLKPPGGSKYDQTEIVTHGIITILGVGGEVDKGHLSRTPCAFPLKPFRSKIMSFMPSRAHSTKCQSAHRLIKHPV